MGYSGYDAVVIGAGVGGPAAGAILAQKEGLKILVLEKAARIGGRDISFDGRGFNAEEYRKLIMEAAHTWHVRSEPSLDEIQKGELLDGFTIEAGIHVLPHSEKGRTNILINYLAKKIDLYPALSAGWWHGGKHYRFERGSEKGGNFPWMDQKAQDETGKINRMMVMISGEEAHRYDHISLQEWMEAHTDNEDTKEFHYVNATMNCTLNYPWTISAGDCILMNRAVSRAGKRFSLGGCSTVGAPGFVQVPRRLCEVIEENGGKVLTNARVKEVLVENKKVKGVLAEVEGKEEKISCPIVINSGIVQEMFRYIPEKHFPADFVKKVKGFWRAGAGLVYFGLKKEVVQEHLTFVPAILGKKDGFEGDIRMGCWASSSMDPTRAPKEKQLLDVYVSLLDTETRNRTLVDKAYFGMKSYFGQHYPGFKEAFEWAIYTVTDTLVGAAQAPGQVGDQKPRAKSPHIEGLFFASDTSECSMACNDAAVHAGIIAASRISGKDYVSEILPDYHQD
jgi:hypothetical protein